MNKRFNFIGKYLLLTTFTLSMIGQIALNPALAKNADAAEVEKVSQSVVKIYTTSNAADYFTPWSMLGNSQSGGSGSIIAGKRILTNAHVIADASFIQVQLQGSSKKYRAAVEFVSHETDLAILKVEKEDVFFKGTAPLKVGKLPDTQTTVRAYGYPMGGKTLSITKGVLSRVEHQSYSHGNGFFLAGQIDAAINPGNSGGPIIVDGKIVGVVMQGNFGKAAENQGYFIPPSIIKHVLNDIKDGTYNGFLEIQIAVQSMESPALKKLYGMSDNQTGVLVTRISEGGSSDGVLQKHDVILSIDGYNIADDKTIVFRDKQRTHFKYALDLHAYDDPAKLVILRDGKELTVSISGEKKLKNPSLARDQTFGELPDYYIYGGVVFVPLNMNLIKRWGSKWRQKAPLDFLMNRDQPVSKERQEIVVALQVLPAEVNIGYHDWSTWSIASVNGKPIANFAQFITEIHNNTNEFLTLADEDGFQMVLNHKEAIETRDSVLNAYRVPAYHSKGLLDK